MRTFTVQSNDGEAKLLFQMCVLRRVASFAKKEMKRRIKKYQYLGYCISVQQWSASTLHDHTVVGSLKLMEFTTQ